jgi:hypothetical protein
MEVGRLPSSGMITAAVNNIPISFDTSSGSRIVTGLQNKFYSHIIVFNETSTRISVASSTTATPPSSSSSARIYVSANGSVALDDVSLMESIYVQSEGTAISSGVVTVIVW